MRKWEIFLGLLCLLASSGCSMVLRKLRKVHFL